MGLVVAAWAVVLEEQVREAMCGSMCKVGGQVEEGLMMIETSSGTREIGSGSVMKVEEILMAMAKTLGPGIAIVALLPTGIELRGIQIRRRPIWRGTSKRIKIWRSLLNQRYFLSETLR